MINTSATEGSTNRCALEVIQAVLEICGSLELGKKTWHATLFEQPVLIPGKNKMGLYVNTIGVLITPERIAVQPKGNYQKLKKQFEVMLTPAIIIPPMFEKEKVRGLDVIFMVGKYKLPDLNFPWLAKNLPYWKELTKKLPYWKEKKQISDTLRANFPELYHA